MKYMNGRYELKYIINNEESNILNFRLNSILSKDPHVNNKGNYLIKSLYFDDYYYNNAMDVESGVPDRTKYRIRYYNTYDGGILHLEKKVKHNDVCYKFSQQITKEEYYKICNNELDNLLYESNGLLRQFLIDKIEKILEPKLIVTYERVPFVEPITNTRVTIDSKVCVSEDVEYFLNDGYIELPVLENNENILEVKFDNFLPEYIKKQCEINDLRQTSFSKYNLGIQAVKEGKIYENYRNF